MHSLLETYLAGVAASLHPMPVKQRNEELREMRAHLENAVIISRELGQSEDEAAQNIVTQFGAAKDLGGSLVWTWRRERRLNRKSFWASTVAAWVLLYLYLSRLLPVCQASFPAVMQWTHSHIVCSDLTARMLIYVPCGLSAFFSIGAGVGWLFPKRAVAGTALIQSGFFIFHTAVWINYSGIINPSDPMSRYERFEYVAINALFMDTPFSLGLLLAAMLGAWLISRRRIQRGRFSHAHFA